MTVGPPAGWLNWYAASSGVWTIVIAADLPFCWPHQDIDQHSITWLWISLTSLSLSEPSGLAERIGWYGLGQSRGSSTPRRLGSRVWSTSRPSTGPGKS